MHYVSYSENGLRQAMAARNCELGIRRHQGPRQPVSVLSVTIIAGARKVGKGRKRLGLSDKLKSVRTALHQEILNLWRDLRKGK